MFNLINNFLPAKLLDYFKKVKITVNIIRGVPKQFLFVIKHLLINVVSY